MRQANQHVICSYGTDYRWSPGLTYPITRDDGLGAYRHVLSHHSPAEVVRPRRLADGTLTQGMLMRGREEDLPMPAGTVQFSLEVNLTEAGDCYQVNHCVDGSCPYHYCRSIGSTPATRNSHPPTQRLRLETCKTYRSPSHNAVRRISWCPMRCVCTEACGE